MRPARLHQNWKYLRPGLGLLVAITIHVGPVLLKMTVDPYFRLDGFDCLILSGLCLLHISLLTLPGRIGSLLGQLTLALALLSTLINVMTLALFKSTLTVGALSTVMQSNGQEVQEFLLTYAQPLTLTGLSFVLISVLFMGLYRLSPRLRSWRVSMLAGVLACLSSLPVLYRVQGHWKLLAHDYHELAYVDRMFTSALRYHGMMQARRRAQSFWNQREGLFQKPLQLYSLPSPSQPQLLVVIIGESTTRRHMGIYGYYRPTTPRLEAMQNQLLVFKNATTPVASTLPAVLGALCSAQFDASSLSCGGPTLLEIARAAGYQTAWISNQAPTGFGDNFIAELGRTADSTVFVNQDVSSGAEADSSVSLDEKILRPLDELIRRTERTGQKTMVFLHMMGTHFIYEKRYPKDQTRMSSADIRSPFASDPQAQRIIDHYDHAVAYQDRILGDILRRLNDSAMKSLFVYFSDHGEEVYNTDNFAGHSEDRVTPAMQEIPFIIGFSQYYLRAHGSEARRLRGCEERPFSSFQLTPTVAGLLGLGSEAFQQEDNIFSERFRSERDTRQAQAKPLGCF